VRLCCRYRYCYTTIAIAATVTVLQFITLWAGLCHGALDWPNETVLSLLCYTTGAATLGSGVSYFMSSGIVSAATSAVF
jgi:hypothetical protein